MSKSQKNEVVLIIGGSKGIGFEIAKEMFNQGKKVLICSRSKKVVDAAKKKIDPSSSKVFGFKVDITSDRDIQSLVKFIKTKLKRVDVLINTAGVFEPFGEFDRVSFNEHQSNINLNLLGTMRVCYALIPIMKKQKYGKIILFSGGGVGGDKPLANASSYYISKTAVAAFTEVLAEELRPYKIAINSILPGQILTDMTRKIFSISPKKLGPILTKSAEHLKKTGGNSIKNTIDLINFILSDEDFTLSGRLLSARWDNFSVLEKDVPDELFKLRRIEGKKYSKVN